MSGALGALAGVRVLDLTRLLPGPFCSRVLGDLGAQVDKLEDTGAGDYLRVMPPIVARGAGPAGENCNAAFELLNTGKRSLSIDLKAPEGRETFLQIAGTYDVVLESFRPGVLTRLGCGPAILLEKYPRIVLVSITGFGSVGPDAERPGHDLGYLARGGVLGVSGPPGVPPAVPGAQMADIGAGLWGVIGVLAALRERDRTGAGQHVEISLLEAAAPFAVYTLSETLLRSAEPAGASNARDAAPPASRGDGPLTGGLAVYGTYATKDGRAVALASVEPKFLAPFFADQNLELHFEVLAPGEHQVRLREKLQEVFASKPAVEWREYAATWDICLEVVSTPEEWRTDPQRLALAGNRPASLMPMPLGTPSVGGAPKRGEHSSEVLLGAGMAASQVSDLLLRGVVQQH